jgi:hypothetical protein
MNSRNYIKGFTIIEAVVSMVLTAIILAIVFVIINVTSQRLDDFRKQNEFINDINRITYSINKNIFESEKMSILENEISLKGYNGQVTKYLLSEKDIIMYQDEFTDTFNITTEKFIVDTLESKSKKIVYQRLSLNIKIGEIEKKMAFYKKLYANELLKMKLKNEF